MNTSSIRLRRHPHEPSVYIHDNSGTVIVGYGNYWAAFSSLEDWQTAEDSIWTVFSLKHAREVLAKEEHA